MSTASGHFNVTGTSRTSFNWHGSIPTTRADEGFEPNFRQFDFILDSEVPDEDLVARVYKVKEGEADWQLQHLWGGQIRATPVVISSIGGAAFVNYMYTRMLSKSAASVRWSFWPIYATILGWNNLTKWYARERLFIRDWQRNQAYSYDEIRQQRDKQRVREALYEKQFVHNPLSEYRVKQWEVSERFA